jgi:CheY-like chemotaxis protein
MDDRQAEQKALKLGHDFVYPHSDELQGAPPPALRVLCVDDYRDSADTLGALLRIYGCEVKVCYDGPTALSEAETFHPDVCVLDLTMPGMDGCEVARLLRQRQLNPEPRFVAVTALGGEEARRRTAAAGFDFHLVKPVDPDELANVVADVVIMQGWSTPR